MKKRRKGGQPAYQEVAVELRRGILSGVWKPNDQIPTEMELCKQFGVSRITVRGALALLEDEQLIRRRQGKGVFVNPTSSRRIPLLNTDFLGSLAAHAPEVWRRMDEHGWVAAPLEIARTLDIPPSTRVFFTRRSDMQGQRPIAYDDVYILEAYAKRLREEDLARLDFLEHWATLEEVDLGHGRQSVEALPADAAIARRLELKPREPVLLGTEVMCLRDNRPAAVFVSYYRYDSFRLMGTVVIGDSTPRVM
jgi:GntR family transcriptional regulator